MHLTHWSSSKRRMWVWRVVFSICYTVHTLTWTAGVVLWELFYLISPAPSTSSNPSCWERSCCRFHLQESITIVFWTNGNISYDESWFILFLSKSSGWRGALIISQCVLNKPLGAALLYGVALFEEFEVQQYYVPKKWCQLITWIHWRARFIYKKFWFFLFWHGQIPKLQC